jgi:hypothetical protein
MLNKRYFLMYFSFKNPEGLTALWVGNVLPDKVDDKKLFKIFSRYVIVLCMFDSLSINTNTTYILFCCKRTGNLTRKVNHEHFKH